MKAGNIIVAILTLAALVSCHRMQEIGAGQADASATDADTDTDTDSDTDVDSDTDSDSDTDTGEDTDTGTPADWDCAGPGVWLDSSQGLCWEVTPDEAPLDWNAAVARCQELVLEGYDDWRMPDIDELRSLVDGCPKTELGGECPVTDGSWFPDSTTEPACEGCWWYNDPDCFMADPLEGPCWVAWSTSTVWGAPFMRWTVDFDTAEVDMVHNLDDGGTHCVRDAQ